MFRKGKTPRDFDRENLRPVIRASICTGEQVAGFQNIHTGKITEIMLIRTDRDLSEFLKTYNLTQEDLTVCY